VARDPSALPLLSDFSGSAGSVYPTGWQMIWNSSSERYWVLDGSGNFGPNGAGWRGALTTSTADGTGSAPVGFRIACSVIPTTNELDIYLLDGTGASPNGYGLSWSLSAATFTLNRMDAGSGTSLASKGSSDVTGTIGNTFQMALVADAAAVEGFASTDDGATWQSLGSSADTAHRSAWYAGIEVNDAATRITAAYFGQQVATSVSGARSYYATTGDSYYQRGA
jgi:hypothetical protein